jgi:hypothetical protein
MIRIDIKKLLGFRLSETDQAAATSAKIGTKAGIKPTQPTAG